MDEYFTERNNTQTYKINTTTKPLLDNHISACLFIETQLGHNQRNLKLNINVH